MAVDELSDRKFILPLKTMRGSSQHVAVITLSRRAQVAGKEEEVN